MANCKFGCGLKLNPITGLLEFLGDSERGLECDPDANGGEGCWFVKVDGSSITYNASGQLQASVPGACALGVPYITHGAAQDESGEHTGENPGIGTVIKQVCTTITNNDPCERVGVATVTFDWSGFAFDFPLAGHVNIEYEYSFDGGATWIEDTDRQSDVEWIGASASRTFIEPIPPGGSVTVCARYQGGHNHDSANTIFRFYNLAIVWQLVAGGV